MSLGSFMTCRCTLRREFSYNNAQALVKTGLVEKESNILKGSLKSAFNERPEEQLMIAYLLLISSLPYFAHKKKI